MRMHQVEVDEEVFQFIKAQAEPLVDTFNSTLKRLLPLSERRGRVETVTVGEGFRTEPANLLPSFPKHIPQAMQQIMEVIHLVRSGYSRSSATHYVAGHHKPRIKPQSVIDKYTRQLNLTAREFDQLLEQPDLVDLRKMLKSKFPAFTQLIDEVIEPISN